MDWVVIALVGYFLASIVALVDKFLLAQKLRPWQYVVYGGFFGITALILVPFGFALPGLGAILLAVLSGVIFLAALYPLYVLINRTEITRASPLVGSLVPIFTLIGAAFFLDEQLSKIELVGFSLLVIGGFVIIFRRSFLRESARNIVIAIVAAVLFAFSFVAIKASFDAGAEFISGYVIARIGSFLFVLLGFFLFRRQFIRLLAGGSTRPKEQIVWVGVSKVLAGVSFLVLNYAIFLGNVSLVQSLQGFQYAFLLIIGGVAGIYVKSLRESFSFKVILIKVIAVLIITLGLVLISLNQRPSTNPGKISTYGVTFSTIYTEQLGLNYQQLFRVILNDLGARNFRLIAYWSEIEPEQDQYEFQKLDWLFDQVEKQGGSVIIALGRKVPRYPECHIPEWAYQLDETVQQREVLELIGKIIERYKESRVLYAWQVENEPFLPTTSSLGKCPKLDVDFLDQEIALVKSLDSRPVIVTDSGELSDWLRAYKRADIFGTSLYRVVWTGFGYFRHISPPEFYFVKENLAKIFYGPKKIITIELQAEPWGPDQTYLLDVAERRKSMDIEQMRKNIAFAQKVGHDEAYLWGAEWWYWEREQGYPEFWEEAKKLFQKP